MPIQTGSTSQGEPQDAQDENFMTTQSDCSLSGCVASAANVGSSLFIMFAQRPPIVRVVSSVRLSLACMKRRAKRAGVYTAPVGAGCPGKADPQVASLGLCLHLTAAGRSVRRGPVRNREMYMLHLLLLQGSKNISGRSC